MIARLKRSDAQQTPLQYLIDNPPPDFDEEERSALSSLSDYTHSIFEFNKIKEKHIFVTDFAAKKKLEVSERRGTSGFLKGSIFEARLLKHGEELYFSGPMLFHPQRAKKYIKSLFKNKDADVQEVVFKLSAMALKCERYSHVPQEKIYCEDAELK